LAIITSVLALEKISAVMTPPKDTTIYLLEIFLPGLHLLCNKQNAP
jgi:hypothetical protein